MEIKSPFDFLNIFFEKKHYPSEESIDKYCNQWILNLTFSCDKDLVFLSHLMSKLKLSNKEYFDCLYYGLPKTKRFIQFNAKKIKEDEENIKILMNYYNCSMEVAKEYLNLIDKDELKRLKEFYNKKGIQR